MAKSEDAPVTSSSEGLGEADPDLFVGRVPELGRLRNLLQPRERGPASALIEGEAGIGKSRLLAEFLVSARESGYRVVRGHCYGVREAGPYFPFLQMLSQLRRAEGAEELLTATAEPSWATREEGPSRRRAQFLRALSEAILREAGASRAVLAIEDIHWADIASLLLLNDLLDLGDTSLIVVCTARIEERTDLAARQLLARVEDKVQSIVLRGLQRQDLGRLVTRLAYPLRIGDEEHRALHSFTRGNPLLAQELLLHLLEAGLLERHNMAEAIRRSETPGRLTHVIDVRLRALPADVRDAVSVCAVMGNEIDASLVGAITGCSEEKAEEQLELAVTRGILSRTLAIGAARYQFSHPLFATRLYGALSAGERGRVHRQIAEAGDGGRIALTVNELAYHYAFGFATAAGDKGSDYCRKAAERAEKLLAYEEAARYWEYALRCLPRRTRGRASLLSRLGWCLWAVRKWTGAIDAWREAVQLLEVAEDRHEVGVLALALADTHRWRSELTEAESWARIALEQPLASLDRGRALALLGHIRCVFDDPAEGVPLLEAAEQLVAEAGGDPFVTYWVAYGYLTSGDPSRAYMAAKGGLEEARRQKRSDAVAFLAGSLVFHELSRLNPAGARSHVSLLEGAVDPTDTPGLARAFICKAITLAYDGRWRLVIQECERWMSQVRLAGRFQVATARLMWSEASLALGDASAAEAELLRALPDLSESRALGALHLARVLLREGKLDEAGLLVHQYAERITARPRHASSRALLGDVASMLDVPRLWQDCYDGLVQEARPLLVVYSPISVQRVLGQLASRQKRWVVAIEHFDTATKQLADGRAWWELAQTYGAYAEMRRARSRRGDPVKAVALDLQVSNLYQRLHIRRGVRPPASCGTNGNRFALTGREIEVLTVLAGGRRNNEIAGALGITEGTVQRHLQNIFGKMDVTSRTEAVIRAVEEGLVSSSASTTLHANRSH